MLDDVWMVEWHATQPKDEKIGRDYDDNMD
jgi:hypothetical protein